MQYILAKKKKKFLICFHSLISDVLLTQRDSSKST